MTTDTPRDRAPAVAISEGALVVALVVEEIRCCFHFVQSAGALNENSLVVSEKKTKKEMATRHGLGNLHNLIVVGVRVLALVLVVAAVVAPFLYFLYFGGFHDQ